MTDIATGEARNTLAPVAAPTVTDMCSSSQAGRPLSAGNCPDPVPFCGDIVPLKAWRAVTVRPGRMAAIVASVGTTSTDWSTMNTSTIPRAARTDVPAHSEPKAPQQRQAVRAGGLAITALVVVFGVLVALPWPEGERYSLTGALAAIALELAIVGVLLIVTLAGGVGRSSGWRAMGAVAIVLSLGTMATSITHAIAPSETSLTVSNTAMFVTAAATFAVALRVALNGSWRGAARALPLVAASWPLIPFIVTVLEQGDQPLAWPAYMTFMTLSHLAIGLTFAISPQLTERARR
ncbi:hypothetical protein [Ruicaihuangia caeni]|uniref:DUF1109 domain-containing protein n=1 Tax=Ruicaihuangia caeni TaxID=3042517 RepID=A0AAW6TB60_9MICO|nr:hypothetical protein [Klugiella sp. YN-L-19]MDI2098832.1 hypothetical protein [Klugiella sp. YN-L-19]